MMRIACLVLALATDRAASGEPLQLSFFFNAPAGIERDRSGDHGYGLIDAALFSDDPIELTLSALNAPPNKDWTATIEWEFEDASGQRHTATVVADSTIAPRPPQAHAMRQDATHIAFRVTDLAPGRYVVRPRVQDPVSGRVVQAPARKLSVYRGDENDTVRRAFLRKRARALAGQNDPAGYLAARELWLAAVVGAANPDIYEELADASAPWAPPDETLEYYARAAELARLNLESRFGKQRRTWPASAQSLSTARERKAQAFQSIVGYYKLNFDTVRVVARRGPTGEHFVIERRSDGAIVRTVDVR